MRAEMLEAQKEKAGTKQEGQKLTDPDDIKAAMMAMSGARRPD